MSMITAAMRELMDLGVEGEALIAAVGRIEAAGSIDGIPRTARQDRNRRHYAKASEKRLKTSESDVSDASDPSKAKVPPTPPSKTQPSSPPSPPKGGSSPTSFEEFWVAYPRKTGKGAARKAYARALSKADPARMLAAVEAASAGWDDPQFIPHPATWLNQERWDDETEPVSAKPMVDEDFIARQAARTAAYAASQIDPPDHRPAEPPRRDGPGGLRSLRSELPLRSIAGGLDPEGQNRDRKRALG